ncbi:MAG: hypothetical protein PHR61_00230 [Candidatus Absconditabacteria bacterium]|nr:hypothetical protein [Candidatus Absconditabacteria bacterium]
MLLASCPSDGRKLRYLINGLLKSGLVQEIKRINYVKSYYLIEKTIEKKEEKLLIIVGLDNEKIKQFVQKQRPEVSFLSGL